MANIPLCLLILTKSLSLQARMLLLLPLQQPVLLARQQFVELTYSGILLSKSLGKGRGTQDRRSTKASLPEHSLQREREGRTWATPSDSSSFNVGISVARACSAFSCFMIIYQREDSSQIREYNFIHTASAFIVWNV